jgi:hypothetical protein
MSISNIRRHGDAREDLPVHARLFDPPPRWLRDAVTMMVTGHLKIINSRELKHLDYEFAGLVDWIEYFWISDDERTWELISIYDASDPSRLGLAR